MSEAYHYEVKGEEALKKIARCIASYVEKGEALTLTGDLGVGKTTFSRYFIQALTPEAEEVVSPTFTLVQLYDTPHFTIWHFDLYRIEVPSALYELGMEEAFTEGVSLIEWPDIAREYLPEDRLEIMLSFGSTESERGIKLISHGRWRQKLLTLHQELRGV